MGQGDTSPIFGLGDTIMNAPLFEQSTQVTIFVPFNHQAVMVKKYFQLILAVYFTAFYFTKSIFHFNVDKEASAYEGLRFPQIPQTPYQGSAPGPRWGLPSFKPPAISPNHGDRSTPYSSVLQQRLSCC